MCCAHRPPCVAESTRTPQATCTEKLAPEEVQRLLSNVREKEVNPQCRIDTSDIKTLRDAKVRASLHLAMAGILHPAACILHLA